MDGVATKTRGTPWRESLPACRLGNKPTWLRSLLKPPVNVYRAFDLDGFGIQSGRIILCVAGRAPHGSRGGSVKASVVALIPNLPNITKLFARRRGRRLRAAACLRNSFLEKPCLFGILVI